MAKDGRVFETEYGASRADVAVGIAFSVENRAGIESVFRAGVYVPDAEAAEVTDVLAHRHLAVDVHARQLRERIGLVLRAQSRRLGLEARGVFGGPPVA